MRLAYSRILRCWRARQGQGRGEGKETRPTTLQSLGAAGGADRDHDRKDFPQQGGMSRAEETSHGRQSDVATTDRLDVIVSNKRSSASHDRLKVRI